MTHDAIGCTVISPAFAKVGAEAVCRFKKFTGLKVLVIRCRDEQGYKTKLELDRRCPRAPVIFFDADWWMLRPHDFASMAGGPSVMGVHDPTVFHEECFPHKDCRDNGLDWQRYMNTGLMILDFRRAQHRAVFAMARRSWARGKKPHDPTDQFHINRAILRLSVPQSLIPRTLNFFHFAAREGCCEIPREVTGLHGAGYQVREKLARLKEDAAVFSRPVLPMKDHAMRVSYAFAHQI